MTFDLPDPETLRIVWTRSKSGVLVSVDAFLPDGFLFATYGEDDGLSRILRMASETGRCDPHSGKLPDDRTMAEAIVLDCEG